MKRGYFKFFHEWADNWELCHDHSLMVLFVYLKSAVDRNYSTKVEIPAQRIMSDLGIRKNKLQRLINELVNSKTNELWLSYCAEVEYVTAYLRDKSLESLNCVIPTKTKTKTKTNTLEIEDIKTTSSASPTQCVSIGIINNNTNTTIPIPIEETWKEVLELYPKSSHRPRKQSCLKVLSKICKDSNLDRFKIAVNNYSKECQIKGTDKIYVMSLNSFVKVWEEYLVVEKEETFEEKRIRKAKEKELKNGSV